MSNAKKGICIVLTIMLLSVMTVACFFAIPKNGIKAKAAEEDKTYYYYEYSLETLPFPMNGINEVDNYELTLTGKESSGVQYKLFDLEIFERVKRGNKYGYKTLGHVQLKTTIDYDSGYCYYPRTADGVSVNWRNDVDWAVYQDKTGSLYGVMSTNINSEEAIYGDKIFWIEFQTLHPLEQINIRITDLYTGYSVLTSNVSDESHTDVYLERHETSKIRDGNIPLYLNDKDTGLSFQSGYDQGFADGEIEGEKNANAGNDSYQLGYNTGFEEGHKEGYKEGSYDVKLELTEVTGNAVGSITDTLMKFLQFEIAGISLWAILAVIGGILVIGMIIKMVY